MRQRYVSKGAHCDMIFMKPPKANWVEGQTFHHSPCSEPLRTISYVSPLPPPPLISQLSDDNSFWMMQPHTNWNLEFRAFCVWVGSARQRAAHPACAVEFPRPHRSKPELLNWTLERWARAHHPPDLAELIGVLTIIGVERFSPATANGKQFIFPYPLSPMRRISLFQRRCFEFQILPGVRADVNELVRQLHYSSQLTVDYRGRWAAEPGLQGRLAVAVSLVHPSDLVDRGVRSSMTTEIFGKIDDRVRLGAR